MSLGLETKPQHGGLDPLDFALEHVNDNNVGHKAQLIETLLSRGVPVEESHRQALEKISNDANRNHLKRVLVNYL